VGKKAYATRETQKRRGVQLAENYTSKRKFTYSGEVRHLTESWFKTELSEKKIFKDFGLK